MPAAPKFDAIADHYDETRGGERRGDHHADLLHRRLPPGERPILDLGAGTGVVTLGLRRRGRNVVGVDIAERMLRRAQARAGAVVAVGDAARLPIPAGAVGHAVAVWVAHSVADFPAVCREVARVLGDGGRFLVVPSQRPSPDDPVGMAFQRLVERLGSTTEGRPTAEEIVDLAAPAGFCGHVDDLGEQTWPSSLDEERAHVTGRSWRFLSTLDEATYQRVTGPFFEDLAALPPGPLVRRALARMAVLTKTPSTEEG